MSIADGDTISVLRNGRPQRVRLNGIDCPESRQPFGTKAKRFTGDLVFGKMVTIRTVDVDRYGRIVADVTLPDGRNLNYELVKAGLAWWYRRYAPRDSILEALELAARKARRGLWVDPHAIAPWEWRKGVRATVPLTG